MLYQELERKIFRMKLRLQDKSKEKLKRKKDKEQLCKSKDIGKRPQEKLSKNKITAKTLLEEKSCTLKMVLMSV